MDGKHQGMISMPQICISQVSRPGQKQPLVHHRGRGVADDLAMALVTYTLLCGLSSGLQSRFHPEVLGASFFRALVVVIVEFCFIKLGCYLLDVRGGGASGVELIGYGGYKFVG